jgi:hypothetical protein
MLLPFLPLARSCATTIWSSMGLAVIWQMIFYTVLLFSPVLLQLSYAKTTSYLTGFEVVSLHLWINGNPRSSLLAQLMMSTLRTHLLTTPLLTSTIFLLCPCLLQITMLKSPSFALQYGCSQWLLGSGAYHRSVSYLMFIRWSNKTSGEPYLSKPVKPATDSYKRLPVYYYGQSLRAYSVIVAK